jgi:hypothetical protein
MTDREGYPLSNGLGTRINTGDSPHLFKFFTEVASELRMQLFIAELSSL